MHEKLIQEQGFAIIPYVLDERDVEILSDSLAHARLHRGSRAGVRNALQYATVREAANDRRLLALARSILAGEAIPFRATLFDKSLESNWLVAWHQDTALPLRKKYETQGWGPWSVKDGVIYARAPASALNRILALRVHLDDSTAENGPLRVLPCTHKVGVLADEAIHELSTRVPHVDCLVQKGGVLAMRPLIVHASSKSHSGKPRRVLHLEYASSPIIEERLELAMA